MQLVLEGPDSAGKTTLAKKLSREFNLPIMKWDTRPLKTPQLLARLQPFYSNLEFIYDRMTLISETIYAEVMGRQPLIGEGLATALMSQYKDLIIIYCCPPKDHVTNTYDPDFSSDHSVSTQLVYKAKLYDAYSRWYKRKVTHPLLNIFKYDFFQQKDEEIFDECRRRNRIQNTGWKRSNMENFRKTVSS